MDDALQKDEWLSASLDRYAPKLMDHGLEFDATFEGGGNALTWDRVIGSNARKSRPCFP
jgi:hypothetical protein